MSQVKIHAVVCYTGVQDLQRQAAAACIGCAPVLSTDPEPLPSFRAGGGGGGGRAKFLQFYFSIHSWRKLTRVQFLNSPRSISFLFFPLSLFVVLNPFSRRDLSDFVKNGKRFGKIR